MKRIIAIAIMSTFVFSTSVWAGSYTIPNTFVGGEKALASEVNSNFTAAKTAIDGNATDITTNAGNISDNASDLATNTGNIANNAGNITINTSNISNNAGNITANTGNISNNAADIATNTSNIADNATDIATNASNIADNAGNIAAIQPLLPIASGIINTDGTIRSATSNVLSCTFNSTQNWYVIGFDFTFSIFDYLVFVQPLGASNPLTVTTDAAGGLIVKLWDSTGTPAKFYFHFIVYSLQ